MSGTKKKRPQGEVIISSSETLVKQISAEWLNSTTSRRKELDGIRQSAENLHDEIHKIFSPNESDRQWTDSEINIERDHTFIPDPQV